MKISHELTLGLMQYGYEWNDYDYCLPHLVDQYEQYRLYFQKSRLDKRFIICDNGLFEGVTHTTEDLLDKINLIRPDIFIVPDAWNDSMATLRSAKEWMNNHKSTIPEETELMAVCQGKTIADLITTYQTLVDLGYKHIAFNHSSVAYSDKYPEHTPVFAKMYGRIELIRSLIEKDTVRKGIYHHLLGCSLPQEIIAYSGMDWIKSVDTSNPIIVGYKGERYTDSGINFKPTEKIEDLFDKDLEDKMEDIIFNIQKFKQFTK